jgi:PAS domain-containing protein
MKNEPTKEQLLEQLQESERKYRFLFDNMQETVTFHKLFYDNGGKLYDYTVEDANKLALKAMGKSIDEVRGKLLSETFSKEFTEPYLPLLEKAIAVGGGIQL